MLVSVLKNMALCETSYALVYMVYISCYTHCCYTGPQRLAGQTQVSQSTISRFSCRICVERRPPYTARIYAAGFDQHNHIFLGVCKTLPTLPH